MNTKATTPHGKINKKSLHKKQKDQPGSTWGLGYIHASLHAVIIQVQMLGLDKNQNNAKFLYTFLEFQGQTS